MVAAIASDRVRCYTKVARNGFLFVVWAARRCIPLAVMRPLIRWKIERRRRDDVALDYARAEMAHLLGESASPAEIEDASRAHIEHWMWWHELRWHPRRITHQPVEGLQNLHRARAEGRGVVLSFVHHAYFDGIFKSLGRHGFHVSTVIATSAARSRGPNTFQFARVMGSGGSIIAADEGLPALLSALAERHVVATAIDVPGRTLVEFAGRKVRCSAGGLVAASRSGAPVVVVTSHRESGSTVLRLSEPISASDFESVDALAQEVVRRHQSPVLAWPSAAYLPQLAWSAVG